MLCMYASVEMKKEMKETLKNQLKNARKHLLKAHASVSAETVYTLMGRFGSDVHVDVSETKFVAEQLKREWTITLERFVSLVDGRLAMIK